MLTQRPAAHIGNESELAMVQSCISDDTDNFISINQALGENKETPKEQALIAKDQADRQLAEQAKLTSDPADAPETDECCADANPLVPQDIALVALILNIISPGVGSIVAAYFDPKGCNCKCATFGILQMLLAIVIAGIVWSIVQGLAIYNKSNSYYEA